MQAVAPNVYRLSGLMVGNVYLTIDPDGMTLIDTSIPRSGTKILQQIAALGRPLSDLKSILITHAHPDHAACPANTGRRPDHLLAAQDP
jgi:glyoxylase-like metal-dependent hydrolase (beta-lactamase superfamily II)